MIRLRLLTALGVVLGVVATTAQATSGESCPEQTRPHATRCDQYFRCVLLPSRTHVWVPTQCAKGLIYEPQLKTCVLPGELSVRVFGRWPLGSSCLTLTLGTNASVDLRLLELFFSTKKKLGDGEIKSATCTLNFPLFLCNSSNSRRKKK